MKTARSFRLSSLAERQLEALARQWGTSITETLTVCIDRTWIWESFASERGVADVATVEDNEYYSARSTTESRSDVK